MNKRGVSRRAKALLLFYAVLTVGFTWQGLVYWARMEEARHGAIIGLALIVLPAEALAVGLWAGAASRRSSTLDGVGIGLGAFLIAFAVDVFLVPPLSGASPDHAVILLNLVIRLPLAIFAAVIGANIGTSFRVVAEDKQRYQGLSE
jgi:hypothetical protein